MAKKCGNCGDTLWTLDLINDKPCGCGWGSEDPPPAIKAEDPAEVIVMSSNTVVKGKYVMFSDETTGANKIHLDDGCVCFTRGNQEVEMVILPGTGRAVKTVKTATHEILVSDMFKIQKLG